MSTNEFHDDASITYVGLHGKNIDILNEIPMENEVINIEESVKDKLLASLYATLDFFKKELEEKKHNQNFTKLENRKFFLRKEADGNQSKRLFSLFKLYNKKDLSDSTSIKSSLLTNDDTIAEQSINILYIYSFKVTIYLRCGGLF